MTSPSDCIATLGQACLSPCMRPCSQANLLAPVTKSIGRCRSTFIMIEIKSVDRVHPAHAKQLITYLRLTGQLVGLLINFGGATLKEGFRRLVNGHGLSAPLRLCAN